MEPGFYVVRMPKRGSGTKLTIESRPLMSNHPDIPRDWLKNSADTWRQAIQKMHPDDFVTLIEIEG